MMTIFKKNQELTGRVQDLTSEGAGVVKIDGYPFFVEGVIPGELIRLKVMKVGKSFGFARLVELLEPSADRVEITDPIGCQIGTMTLQHMNYDAQLRYKQQQVDQIFRRIGGFDDVEVCPTIGMNTPWQYRNKAQIPVRQVNGVLETGFFRKNSHDLIPVENFHIQHPEIDRAIVVVRNVLRALAIPAYDETTQQGLVRHVVVKRGHYSGEMMIILVVNDKQLPNEADIVARLRKQLPAVVSIVLNTNTKHTNVIMGRENRVLYGQDYYSDTMLGLSFNISANSFYQVNTPQAETLYQVAIDAAQLTGEEVVLDAYCGIGTISLALAQQAKQVYAMEIVPEAIQMANLNAKHNAIGNVVFEVGKAEAVLPQWNESGIQFDVAVVDPPRKGLDETFVQTLIEQSPERIVYVSCNPATCARDCKKLCESGYQLQWVQPVDLFGQTAHVETVVLLSRNK
ncbi:23S rRNA (uracil(1939)-C(5))-methyltransferase RlmD [Aerococcaceae bacterium NML190073]|nr:23S rRNA (uracil(1939)-C(5))-methyltransferase RlmD [Aerococcaceae bacterium NML190073]